MERREDGPVAVQGDGDDGEDGGGGDKCAEAGGQRGSAGHEHGGQHHGGQQVGEHQASYEPEQTVTDELPDTT